MVMEVVMTEDSINNVKQSIINPKNPLLTFGGFSNNSIVGILL